MSTRKAEGTVATGQEVPVFYPEASRTQLRGTVSLDGKTGADCTPFDASDSHGLS